MRLAVTVKEEGKQFLVMLTGVEASTLGKRPITLAFTETRLAAETIAEACEAAAYHAVREAIYRASSTVD
jgi:hypothetical protein